MNPDGIEPHLKYLGFFPAAVASAWHYLSTIYEAAKSQAGPLRPGVEDVEDVLKTVLRPVVRIAEEKSSKLLDYVDKKVDEKLKLVDEHMPAFVKPLALHAQQMIFRAEPLAVLNVKALEFQGPTSSHVGACDRGHHSEYWTYDAFSRFVAGLGLGGAVRMVGPGVLYGAEIFNQLASSLRGAQIPFSSYIPEVPLQALAKALQISSSNASWQAWQVRECEGAC